MKNENYIFLSYSNQDSIEDYVTKLRTIGYNVLYNEAINFGEEWDLKTREQISNPHCKGILSFFSNNAIKSNTILTEIEHAIKYSKPYSVITLQGENPQDMLAKITKSCTENERFIAENLTKYFSPARFHLNKSDFCFTSSKKLIQTLSNWGIFPKNSIASEYITSTYTSEIYGEKERLVFQSEGYTNFDKQAITTALSKLKGDELVVLDLGCSNGFVTHDRFLGQPRIKKVIGVDYCIKDIAQAQESFGDDKFSFYVIDLNDDNFEKSILNILKENGLKKVDLVFASFIIQHVKKPKILLLKLLELLNNNGEIIIRESDDGCKVGYPNDYLIEKIIKRTNKLIKTSDRTIGRKLYNYLHESGYKNIEIYYQIMDTINKTRKEKEWLFTMGFSFRLNRIKNILAENPENEFLKREVEWLEKSLEKLRESFYSQGFYYSTRVFITIAKV